MYHPIDVLLILSFLFVTAGGATRVGNSEEETGFLLDVPPMIWRALGSSPSAIIPQLLFCHAVTSTPAWSFRAAGSCAGVLDTPVSTGGTQATLSGILPELRRSTSTTLPSRPPTRRFLYPLESIKCKFMMQRNSPFQLFSRFTFMIILPRCALFIGKLSSGDQFSGKIRCWYRLSHFDKKRTSRKQFLVRNQKPQSLSISN
jgi:hypothetical protein